MPIPFPLARFDRRMLFERPHLWASGAHWFALFSLVLGNAALYGLGKGLTAFPEVAAALPLEGVQAGVTLCAT